jgi:hypothetical protein
MFGDCGLADMQLARNEQSADAVLDQISIALRWKMASGVFEPLQDLQPALVPEGLDCRSKVHSCQLRNKLIDYATIDIELQAGDHIFRSGTARFSAVLAFIGLLN